VDYFELIFLDMPRETEGHYENIMLNIWRTKNDMKRVVPAKFVTWSEVPLGMLGM
jgi:hypothetical protein